MIDPDVYLINLDRDLERLEYVGGQLKSLGVAFKRVPAIHGLAMPEWLKPYFLNADGSVASQLMPGEVGCYASHLLVMRMIIESGKPGIVLEDDLRLATNFREVVTAAIDALPSDLDMLKLTLPGKRRHFPVRTLGGDRRIVKFGKVPVGTGAYLITPAGAHRFLTYRSARSIPIDQELRRPWLCPLKLYGLMPAPAEQNVLPSTISTFGARLKMTHHERRSPLLEAFSRIRYEIGWLGPRAWARSLVSR
jgi:glycosyl transferase family 25